MTYSKTYWLVMAAALVFSVESHAQVAPDSLAYGNGTLVFYRGLPIATNHIGAIEPTYKGGKPTLYRILPNLPNGVFMTDTSGVFTGNPTVLQAPQNYTITATNFSGTTQTIVSVEVIEGPPPPPNAFTYKQPVAAYVVGLGTLNEIANRSKDSTIRYSISPVLPQGMGIDSLTGNISGTPRAPATTQDYAVAATRAGVSTLATVRITVDSIPWERLIPETGTFPLDTTFLFTKLAQDLWVSGCFPPRQTSLYTNSNPYVSRNGNTFKPAVIAAGDFGGTDVRPQFQFAQRVNDSVSILTGNTFASELTPAEPPGYVFSAIFMKTTDRGTTWTKSWNSNFKRIEAAYFVSADLGYIATTPGDKPVQHRLFKTFNGGADWIQGPSLQVSALWFTSADTGFGAGNDTIWKTTNGGVNWTPWPVSVNVRALNFLSPTVGFAAGDSGRIFKTVNGGNSWNPMPSRGTLNNLYGFYFRGADTCYAVGDSGTVVRTYDGGTTWTSLPSAGKFRLYSVVAPGGFVRVASSGVGVLHRQVPEEPLPPSIPPHLAYPSDTLTFLVDAAITPVTPTYTGSVPMTSVKADTLPKGVVVNSVSGTISGDPWYPYSSWRTVVSAFNDGELLTRDTIYIRIKSSSGIAAPPSVSPRFNLANGQFAYFLANASPVRIRLLDLHGRVTWESHSFQERGRHFVMLPAGRPSLYFLEFSAGKNHAMIKIPAVEP